MCADLGINVCKFWLEKGILAADLQTILGRYNILGCGAENEAFCLYVFFLFKFSVRKIECQFVKKVTKYGV